MNRKLTIDNRSALPLSEVVSTISFLLKHKRKYIEEARDSGHGGRFSNQSAYFSILPSTDMDETYFFITDKNTEENINENH